MKVYAAEEAHRLWRAGRVRIIDVREQAEHDVTSVPGVPLLPMSEIQERVDEIPMDLPLVVLCRSGGRSAAVAGWIEGLEGFPEPANLEGGIIAWGAAGLPYQGAPPA